jgi:CDP-diacylglycerol pyrophosphatase
MTRPIGLLIILVALLAATNVSPASERGLLWRVVQTCIANHLLTGAAFPCLEVDLGGDRATGYAVLRAPLESTHIIATPTIRTIGIEAERLRGDSAPNYFQDAWQSRHFVSDGLARRPARDDVGLAVNSKPGRSQDQLHIHVDCLRPDVKAALSRHAPSLRPNSWSRISILPHAPHYWASLVASDDLSGINLFDRVADGLHIDADAMDDTTIVVAGHTSTAGKPGFIVLARQLLPDGRDNAHGEALLDHSCRAFQ